MKIRIAALENGLNRWEEVISPADLELEPQHFKSDITVSCQAVKRTGRIEISMTANTSGEYRCDRCGEDYRQIVGGDIAVVFIQRDSPLPEEMPGDELRSYRPRQEEIDVRADIRDMLLLSLPLRLLCCEDCRGICQRCGANLNFENCCCEKSVS